MSAQSESQEGNQQRPKVYCDGCGGGPRKPLSIGVYSAECGIEISWRTDQYGTSNEAECLAAIAALEECKRRGISGIRLLSDSKLVVGWGNGRYGSGPYGLKSRTARKYVPCLRQLLGEVEATIEWISGETNLADRCSRRRHQS